MSKPSPPPRGLYAPALTFFNADETIDYPSTTAHIKRLLSSSVRGLVILGTNGEAAHLMRDEKIAVMRHAKSVIEEEKSEAVIIAGCSATSVRETLCLIQDAEGAGAEYALVLVPSYWPGAMTKAVIESFFAQLAEKSPLPILLYNNPSAMAGIDMDSDTMARISVQSPNVVGVKLSCGSAGKLNRLAASLDPTLFAPFCGKADVLLAGLVGGSQWAISALANVAPRTMVELMRLYEQGKLDEARRIQGILAQADVALAKVGVSGAKKVCVEWFGYGNTTVRAPLPEAGADALTPMRETLQKLVNLEKQLTGLD